MTSGLTIIVTGDLFPNGRFFDDRASDDEFAELCSVLESGDLRHATFLMPLSDRGQAMDKVAVIRAEPFVADDVGRLPLDVLSLANNHSFDFGPDALMDTIAALQGAGIEVLGAGENRAVASEPVVVDRQGRRVGIVAFSCLVPLGAAATDDRPGIAAIRVNSSYEVHAAWSVEEPGEPEVVQIHTFTDADDQRRALEQVRSLRSSVDVLVVSVHWGFGAGERLAEYQRPLGRAFIDAGADLVFGHHVHGVQGVEIHNGHPILYSAGTLVGRQASEDPATLSELAQRLIADMTPDGFIARLTFDGNALDALELLPTSHDDVGVPHLSRGLEFDRVAQRIVRTSAKLGTTVSIAGDSLVVDLGS